MKVKVVECNLYHTQAVLKAGDRRDGFWPFAPNPPASAELIRAVTDALSGPRRLAGSGRLAVLPGFRLDRSHLRCPGGDLFCLRLHRREGK